MKKYFVLTAAALCLAGAVYAQEAEEQSAAEEQPVQETAETAAIPQEAPKPAPAPAAAAKPKMEIRFQPYLQLYWKPVLGDPAIGETHTNYRALQFNQAGIKVTGTFEKASLYWEARGVPSGGVYDPYDTDQGMIKGWANNAAYYAWGKYQFTSTGNLWIGKFKPTFGPVLIDASVMGAGWQQKLGALGLNIYAVQPSYGYGASYQVVNAGLLAQAKEKADVDEGVAGIITLDYGAKTFNASGGLSFHYISEYASSFLFDAMAMFRGVPKLTIMGDLLVTLASATVSETDTTATTSESAIKVDKDKSSLGLGVYISAEYAVTPVINPGISFLLATPDLEGESVSLQTAEGAYAPIKGKFTAANIGVYCKIQPQRSFYFQPGLTIKAGNALNDSRDGKDSVTYDFTLTFRWEPSFNVGL